MVAGADHDQHRPEGVRRGQHAQHGPATAQEHHPGAPERPAHVQRRHRGQLVGEPAQALGRARVASPPPVGRRGGEHVDVAGQHPRRCHRQQHEADQAEPGGQHQRVARPPVAERVPAIHPHQNGRRDEVVQRGVPVAGGQREPRHTRQQVVGPGLDVEVQRGLQVQQPVGVRHGPGPVVVREQPGGAVADVQQGQQGELDSRVRPHPAGPGRERRPGAGHGRGRRHDVQSVGDRPYVHR